MIDDELKSRLKPVVNHRKHWEPLTEYIEHEIQEVLRVIEQTDDMNKLFKCKGQIEAYRNMLKLQDKVLHHG